MDVHCVEERRNGLKGNSNVTLSLARHRTIVSRERRWRLSQLAWCGGPDVSGLICAAALVLTPLNHFYVKLSGIMSTAKQDVEALLSKLPDDCSLEDIQYHLYVIEKVRNGLEAADSQGTVSQEEVERQVGKWLTE